MAGSVPKPPTPAAAVAWWLVAMAAVAAALVNTGDEIAERNGGGGSGGPSAGRRESANCNVAVIPLHGGLGIDYVAPNEETDGEPIIASGDVVEAIRAAAEDSSIEAIIVDVNSPGGSPVAADEIERALQRVGKPTVSLVREQAMSGGYLAAAGARAIVATPYALVGGLGVTSSYLDETGAVDRRGMVFRQLSTGKYKDIGNPDKPLTDDERTLIMEQLEVAHSQLVEDISRLRNLPTSTVAQLANGAPYSTDEALGNGLIDSVGGMPEAMEQLRTATGNDSLTVCQAEEET